jgi:glycerophosphoryl diester phosphodiesterase
MAKVASRRKKAAIGVLVFLALVYLNNTSLLAEPLGDGPFLVAHRALGQDFDRQGLTGKTCTANRMLPPEHNYLENTIPAIRAAFAFGADIVEFDVHRTTDGGFAVFHDWTLDCRTNGQGVTREQSLATLQTLDIGYGYTADGGKTWPFRGQGVGMMPSLEQVLSVFPDRDFIIDVKSNDAGEGALLAERIAALPAHRQGRIMVHGGIKPIDVIRERLPSVQTITRARLKRCLLRYLAIGWTGYVPQACERGVITVPANYAHWLWGWPNRFLQRMDSAASRVVVIGDYRGENYSMGVDDPVQLSGIADGYSGGIWTNRIDLIGPAVKGLPEQSDDR